VVGTIGHVQRAFDFLQQRDIDGAIVDINLRGDTTFPVCEELQRLNVPFIFLSGYDRSVIPQAFVKYRLLSKPFERDELKAALAEFAPGATGPGATGQDAVAVWLGNELLDGLTRITLRAMAPRLERVTLKPGQLLHAMRAPLSHIYFPSEGLVTLFTRDRRSRRLAVGMVGREGMIGTTEVLSAGAPAFSEAIVDLQGEAWRIAAEDLSPMLRSHRELRTALLTYAKVLIEEIAQTAVVTGHGTVEQRLARWLLIASLRSGRPQLEFTHEHLSQVLAVRRSGVTVALHELEEFGAIKAHRQLIKVADSERLRRAANGFV
jgi:CRP-like cAMP-binding protein